MEAHESRDTLRYHHRSSQSLAKERSSTNGKNKLHAVNLIVDVGQAVIRPHLA